MRADVLDDVEGAVAVAGQAHRALADLRACEVAGVGHLGLEADVAPVAAVEYPLELAAIQRLVGVRAERGPGAVEIRGSHRRQPGVSRLGRIRRIDWIDRI